MRFQKSVKNFLRNQKSSILSILDYLKWPYVAGIIVYNLLKWLNQYLFIFLEYPLSFKFQIDVLIIIIFLLWLDYY